MSKSVNAALIALAVFVVMAGSIFYFTVIQAEDDVEINSIRTRWASGSNSTVIAVAIEFQNNMDLDVELREIETRFAVNGETLGTNVTRGVNESLAGGQSSTVNLRIEVPAESVSEWFRSHVEEDEASTARLSGSAVFGTPKEEDARVEFDETTGWETDLVGGVSGIDNCASATSDLCVEDAEGRWAVEDDAAVLETSLTVSNSGQRDVRITEYEFELRLGGVPVAKASGEGPLVVEAGDEEDLDLRLFFRHQAMVTWWPEHVGECESSDASLDGKVSYSIVEPEPEPEDNETEDNQTGTGNQTGGNGTSNSTGSQSPQPTNSTEPDDNSTNGTAADQALGALDAVRLQPSDKQDSTGRNETAEWTFDLGTFETAFVCAAEA